MRYVLLSFLILTSFHLFSQQKIRIPAWTFNTQDTDIYGISVGYALSEKIENVTTHGIRFEVIGLGIFLPMIGQSPLADSDSVHQAIMDYPYSEKINGINISPLGIGCECIVNGINVFGVGSITRKINGINLSFVMNFVEVQNGLEASFFMNEAYRLRGVQSAYISNIAHGDVTGLQVAGFNSTAELKGVQIGIINITKKIKGLQIGLWNVNEKRKLPIINF